MDCTLERLVPDPTVFPPGKVALALHIATSVTQLLKYEAPIAPAATEQSKLRLLKPVIVASPTFQCLEIEVVSSPRLAQVP